MSTYLHAKEGAVQLITPTRSMPNMVSLLVLPPTWNRAHYQWLDDWMCPHRKEAHKNSVVAWSREPHIIPFLYRLIYLKLFFTFRLLFKYFIHYSHHCLWLDARFLLKGDKKGGSRLMLTLYLHRLERSGEQRQLSKKGIDSADSQQYLDVCHQWPL